MQLRDRTQRPHSPPGAPEECLVLDTNVLIKMCAVDPDRNIDDRGNLIRGYEDCFKLLKRIIINLNGRIKVVIPKVVVSELDLHKKIMKQGKRTQLSVAAVTSST